MNLGLKDKTKGFLPFGDDINHLMPGTLVQIIIKTVMASSKIAKCEIIQNTDLAKAAMGAKEATIHNIKAGFLVNAKIQKLLENGLELTFMSGFTGTVFVDHLDKSDPAKYKIGEKL